jgi:hypothetical protein
MQKTQILIPDEIFPVRQSNLTNLNLVILDNIILSDVNLLHSQVLIHFLRIVQFLSVTNDLGLNKQPQAVCVEHRKTQYAHQQHRKQVGEKHLPRQVLALEVLLERKQPHEQNQVHDADDQHDLAHLALQLLEPVLYDIRNERRVVCDLVLL